MGISISSGAGRRPFLRRKMVLILAAAALLAWLLHRPAGDWIVRHAVLTEAALSPEVIRESVERASDPAAAIQAAWATGKIQQRTVAIQEAGRYLEADHHSGSLMTIVREAVTDPDISVRELGLPIFAKNDPQNLIGAIAFQLADPDPEVQLLGLRYLPKVSSTNGIPLALNLLGGTDRRVSISALNLLTRWSGKDFGVKLVDTIPWRNGETGITEIPEQTAADLDAKLASARAWWGEHATEFIAADLKPAVGEMPFFHGIPAGDFTITDLQGRPVHLSDFKGKSVVVNFWTTWCTACVAEMPDLTALQNRHASDVVVLAVSLDAVPDEHGHIGGHVPENEAEHEHLSLPKFRSQVARVAAQRGMTFRVALDETGIVSAKYNGGELPTTLIIDPQGNIRRRYVGGRSLPVLEALIAGATRAAASREVTVASGKPSE